jgi:hypothetical protein
MQPTKILLPIIIMICVMCSCTKTTTTPPNTPPVVDAGPAQTVLAWADSVNLSGSTTDSKSPIVSYLWSEVSGPTVPVISAEGSLSTRVIGLMPGTYVYQLMATDTFGLTGVDTMSITVMEPIIYIYTPDHNPNEFDYLGNPANQYSSPGQQSAELGAETWTIDDNTVYLRAAFQFDLSNIPAGTTIRSAKLSLYSMPTPTTANLVDANFGTANAMYIQRISATWDPTNTTWATQPPAVTTNQVSIPQTDQSYLDLIDVDVTALVNDMIINGNHGFMIRLQDEQLYNCRIFCSSKYSDASKHPKLTLEY